MRTFITVLFKVCALVIKAGRLRRQQTKVLKKHIVDIDKLIKDYIQLLLDSIDDEIVNNIIGHNDEPNENRRTKRVCTLLQLQV